MSEISYREAVIQALDEELERDEDVFLFGQDVGRMGGNFATTRGLFDKYGSVRVRDTPISEDAMIGLAIGSSIAGKRPIVEIMFSSFLGCAWDELCNHASQIYYVSNGACVPRLTIRTVNVLGRSSGCHHSGRPEAALAHLPGLVVIAPSIPYDVKAMLKYAIRSDDPIVVIENAMLYGSATGPVGDSDVLLLPGKARIVREGGDITLLAYSGTVQMAEIAASALELRGVAAEVVDLRSLAPLDDQAILESVAKTGRVIVVEEDVRTAGMGAEILTRICETIWDELKATPRRIAAADTPVPFSPSLEEAIAPTAADVIEVAMELCEGSAR